MAVGGIEVELVSGGITEQPAERGRWVQNMWRPRGRLAWETRPGFGQLCSYDSTMDTPPEPLSGSSFISGYEEHLGSASVTTKWGAIHLVSVFMLRAQTGEANNSASSVWSLMYGVSIVDVETGDRWEEVLHKHTSSLADGSIPQPEWRGCYETNTDKNRQHFTGALNKRFHFHVYDNALFFGNEITGLLTYFPSDFRSSRRRTVDSSQRNHWVKGYSESSLITGLIPVDGLYPESYIYLRKDDLPPPVALTTIQTRLVWAGANEIYFSEPMVPNAFSSANFVNVPSQKSITAVVALLDNLLVFTESEMFLYQPSAGDVASAGRFITVSTSVGCLGGNTVASRPVGVSWCDRNGIYTTSNGLSIETISLPIHEFFADGVTTPLNHYLTKAGATDLSSGQQPRTLLKFQEDDLASLVYWAAEDQLLFCSPSNLAAWCFSGGEWSLWSVESSAFQAATEPSVKAVQNILNPYFVVGGQKLYCVGSLEQALFLDLTSKVAVYSSSYYLLELGRGGGLDRSFEYEDYRSVANYYAQFNLADYKNGSVYFDEPYLDAVSGDLFQRVYISQNSAVAWLAPSNIHLRFGFNATDWSLRENPALPGTLDVALPTERIASITEYVTLTVDNVLGNVDIVLNTLLGLNMAVDQKNPFFILRWQRASSSTSLSFGITPAITTISDLSPVQRNVASLVWNAHNGPAQTPDFNAQAVDWAYKSPQVGESGSTQIRARGLFSLLISHGSALYPIVPFWLWGLFNTLSAGDWKGWSSQVVDFTGDTPAIDTIKNKGTVRTRFKDSSGALAARTFKGGPNYSEFLIDDEELDTIAISDSARGESITYMLFGFIRDKAEKLVLASSKVSLRPNQGSRRRKGR